MAILETKNLRKIYGSGENEVHALDGVSISVNEGEFVAVIGTSGSGKSTLLNMIGGLDRPTSGDVTIRGKQLLKMKDEELTIFRRRNIGFVFQNYNLFQNKTALQNVTEGLIVARRLPKAEAIAKAKRALDKVGLADRCDHYPSQLSGGQQQRVGIARALATDPQIIFFDEPTSALDPEWRGEVLSVMRQLAQEGMTMLIVTHELSFARQVSNQVIFMENGLIVESGSAEAFFAQPQKERTKAFLKGLDRMKTV